MKGTIMLTADEYEIAARAAEAYPVGYGFELRSSSGEL
jgi:hypothetical protein